MFEIKEKPKMVERALLLGAYTNTDNSAEATSLLEELEELVNTLIAERQKANAYH